MALRSELFSRSWWGCLPRLPGWIVIALSIRLTFDATAAGYLAWLLTSGRIRAHNLTTARK